jgi:hypothetical protein
MLELPYTEEKNPAVAGKQPANITVPISVV